MLEDIQDREMNGIHPGGIANTYGQKVNSERYGMHLRMIAKNLNCIRSNGRGTKE